MRATTIFPGSSEWITAIPYAPCTCDRASATASSRFPSHSSSMR